MPKGGVLAGGRGFRSKNNTQSPAQVLKAVHRLLQHSLARPWKGLIRRPCKCFPDIEKVAVPSAVVPKAGTAIQKTLAKLSARLLELSECVDTDLASKATCLHIEHTLA